MRRGACFGDYLVRAPSNTHRTDSAYGNKRQDTVILTAPDYTQTMSKIHPGVKTQSKQCASGEMTIEKLCYTFQKRFKNAPDGEGNV